ncbi:hypothetical protein ACFYY8_38815 [Streptosporangium sp. NPDC001559]|uniref:hypothetical protein n=1 Tax=Streptosporangium sp. NPDC001559 TaxID=3366187 RepID=UPI0036E49134
MNARSRVSAVCATALLTATMVTGTATSASASPTGCSYQINGQTASSYCSGGTGEHRVFVLQKHFLAEVGYIPIYSEWAPAGTTSSTWITAHQIVSVQVQTR